MKTGGFFPPVSLMTLELLTLGHRHGLTSTAKLLTAWFYIINKQPELQTWHNTSQMSVSGLSSAFIFLASKLRAVWPLKWKLIGWKSNLRLGWCCGSHWKNLDSAHIKDYKMLSTNVLVPQNCFAKENWSEVTICTYPFLGLL